MYVLVLTNLQRPASVLIPYKANYSRTYEHLSCLVLLDICIKKHIVNKYYLT